MGTQYSINSNDIAEPTGKDGHISIKATESLDQPSGPVAHAYLLTPENAEKTTLRRLFNFIQLLAFSLTFMESWEVIAMNLGATFWNGGPSSLVWGVLLVMLGALCQACSMAELAAIQPIAGAQYHWTHFLAPEKHRRFITWMQGWVTWFAWVSALAGSTSSQANILIGLVTTNYSDYVPKSWHVTLLIIGMLVFAGLINQYGFPVIPWLELVAGILHVVLFVIFVTVLLATGPRNSSEMVFLEQTTSSGWGNNFVAWNLGLLTPAWGFIGFDGVVHMSEEVRKAKQSVPRAMVYTIIINGALSYAIVIVILYTMGNPEDVMGSAYPIIPICINATGSLKAANAMITGLLIMTFCVIAASLASVSRITWAWARDGALPMWFAKIDARHRIPHRALWLPVLIVALLSLLNVKSTAATAFGAFTSLSSLGLYTSYIIAIACMLHARLTRPHLLHPRDGPSLELPDGQWRLPAGWGIPVNLIALLWTVYLSLWLPFPTTRPVTASNMNYAGPVYAFVVLASLSGWWAWGQKRWPGLNASVIHMVEAER